MIQGIRFHTEMGYLTVEVDGQWDLRDAEHVIESIRDEARKRGQTRIFLDLHNFLPPESIMTRYFTGEYIAEHWGYPFRIAALWSREYYDGLAVSVAVNRGAIFQVFFVKEKALEWLLKESNKMDSGNGN